MKNYVKYLGIVIDKNLSWKIHIDNVATKLSKMVGLIAKLRHFVPQYTLLNIYRALILPYLSYGLIAWGQASKTHLTKILLLQKKLSVSYFLPTGKFMPFLFLLMQISCQLAFSILSPYLT